MDGRLSDLPPGVSVNDPHINPPAPKPRRRALPNTPQGKERRKGEGKINAYVRAYFKHQSLGAQYKARIEKLAPLKRKVDAAHTDLKIRHQKMTGGWLAEATRRIIAKMPDKETKQ